MDNTFFLRIEIVIFIISLWYVLYYLNEKILIIFKNIKNIISPDKKPIQNKINKLKKIEEEKTKKQKEKVKKESKITAKDSKKISEILKRVKLNKSKWYYDTAKSLIIEWLSIDKINKDLNLELASIYEEEKEYVKAEYIYIDLLNAYTNNFEILKKLGYNLAIQKKYEESIDIYLKAHSKNSWDIEVIDFLSNLTYEIKFYKKSLKFIKLFLKQHPRNTEKLKMKWFCLETLGETKDAISTYKKVLDLQPYNSQVIEKIEFLESQI